MSGKLVDGELHLESDNVDDLYRLVLCARMRIGHVDDAQHKHEHNMRYASSDHHYRACMLNASAC